MNKTRSIYIISAIVALISLSGCTSGSDTTAENKPIPITVAVQNVSDSGRLELTLEYPALVAADQEADILAKSAGTVKSVNFKVGDRVTRGQTLITVDDTGTISSAAPGTLTASQVRQASLAVDQAESSLHLAQINYDNLLAASEKNLNQAAIARDQAKTGETNLETTSDAGLKSAQLALATAETAVEQAKLNLDNVTNLSSQTIDDARTNAGNTADSVANTAGSAITALNNITDLDTDHPIGLDYKSNLGVLDLDSQTQAAAAYRSAKDMDRNYNAAVFTDTAVKVDAAISLVDAALKLANSVKYLFDQSVTSLSLPLNPSGAGGASLSGLQAAAAGYQTQLAAALAQIKAAKQGLATAGLDSQTNLDNLNKAYELALDQKNQAEQNLAGIKAGNKSQLDQAGFGVNSAENQYQTSQINIDTQLAAARNQLDIASLAYRNAQIALQNAVDSFSLITPIAGVVTNKFTSVGDTISFGQLLAVVSDPDSVKLTFYVDKDTLADLKLGQAAAIETSDRGEIAGHISSIALNADSVTKRFLVEARPDDPAAFDYALGSVLSLKISIEKQVLNAGDLLLPISAIQIGQNENTIFIARDGQAIKQTVAIVRVVGETAEIKADLPPDAQVIVSNSKVLSDGASITIN